MRYRWTGILLLLGILLTGCAGSGERVSSGPVLVTDEETLAWLWEDHLSDAVGTIGNGDFAAPEEVQQLGPFIYYALERLAAEGELTVTDDQITLPPLADMQAQLKRYFDTDFDLNERSYAEIYDYRAGDPEQGTLHFSPHRVSYAESLRDDYRLGEVTYDEAAGIYQAAVEHIANRETGRVDLTRVFTLKQRDNGELYFLSHHWQYPPLPEGLVELTGDFTELPGLANSLASWQLQLYPDYMAGSWGDHLLMVVSAFTGEEHYRDLRLFTYSPEEDRVLSEYTFRETAEHVYSGLRLQGDRLLLRFTDGYTYLDGELQPLGDLRPLPEAVRSAVDCHYEWSGCYEVSEDERTFYYLREAKELWRYDTVSETSERLFERAKLDFSGNYGLFDLQLLPGEQTLGMTLAGYGGPLGPYIVSLDAPAEGRQYRTHYEALTNWSNDGCPLPDVDYSTLLAGGAYQWSLLPVEGSSAAVSFIVPVTEEQQFVDVSLGDHLLYNDRYAVYSNRFASGRYPEDDIYHLIRVDLQTHTAQTLLSAKAAELQPIAVLSDGRVLFRYAFEQLHGWGLTAASH